MNSVASVRDELQELFTIFLNEARCSWATAFVAKNFEQKAAICSAAADSFDLLSQLQSFLRQRFHIGPRSVRWAPTLVVPMQRSLSCSEIDKLALDRIALELHELGKAKFKRIRDFLDGEPAFAYLISLLERVVPKNYCQRSNTVQQSSSIFTIKATGGVSKAITGPLVTALDSRFKPEYSILKFSPPTLSNDIRFAVPYFWTLSTRESRVSDACTLSGIEYDGLPLQFYCDMARQSADEARHAVMFIRLARELMPVVLNQDAVSKKTLTCITSHLSCSAPLPVPFEEPILETMWNSDLAERLILMQIETEGPAVAGAKKAIQSDLARSFPSVRTAFEIDFFDEIAHARIGHRWLRYLIPSIADRREMLETAKILRAPLLLTSLVGESDQYSHLVSAFSAGRRLPSKSYFDS